MVEYGIWSFMGYTYCSNSIHDMKMINTLRTLRALYVIEIINASVPNLYFNDFYGQFRIYFLFYISMLKIWFVSY